MDGLIQLLLLVTVYGMSYLVLARPEWIWPKSPKKYATSKLDGEWLQIWSGQLDQWMKEHKAFTRPDLSLEEVAGAISISRHQLSQLLSSIKGQNFYEYLNALRVREFIRLLEEGNARQYTLLSLARQAGFSSKTTFNVVFKKSMGMTPSEYRKTYHPAPQNA